MGGGSQIIELHWAIVVAFYQPSNRDCVINLSLVKSKCHSLAEKNGDEGIGGRQKRAGQVILFVFVIWFVFVISVVQFQKYSVICICNFALSFYLKVHEPSSARAKGPVHLCLDR